MARIRTVMVASDFSPASRAAFARAVELAKANRARLLVMHALTLVPPMLGGEYIPPQAWDRIEAAGHAQARDRIKALVAKAKRAGVRAAGLVMVGSPYEVIVRAARSKRVDVLVLGTHGRTSCHASSWGAWRRASWRRRPVRCSRSGGGRARRCAS
jgi:universal stress protein A